MMSTINTDMTSAEVSPLGDKVQHHPFQNHYSATRQRSTSVGRELKNEHQRATHLRLSRRASKGKRNA